MQMILTVGNLCDSRGYPPEMPFLFTQFERFDRCEIVRRK